MGVDLLDFYRGKVSLRRIVIFSCELDKDSLVCQELLRREHGDLAQWNQNDYLLADVVDELRYSNYIAQHILYKETQNPPTVKKPKPAFRPGGKEKEVPEGPPLFADETQIQAFLDTYTPGVISP